MSLTKLLTSVAVVAGTAGGLLLWHRHQSAMPAPASSTATTATAERAGKTIRPELPPRTLPTGPPDVNVVNSYKQSRLPRVDAWDSWVRGAGVSSEQEAKVLQILADAQAIYDETDRVREQLRSEATRMRNTRMTPNQQQRLKEARARYLEAFKRHDDPAIVEADKVYAELSHAIDETLEVSAPADERAAFAAVNQVEADLEAQVLAAFAEFLTPRQIEAFGRFSDVSMLLEESYSRWSNEQYAKELAARPHDSSH